MLCELETDKVTVEVPSPAAGILAEIVAPDVIYDVKADIYAPCALGATLNPQTLDRITAKAVVGAANNQLATPEIGRTLFDKGVQMRMGQCNVRVWTDTLLPLVEDPEDPLGVGDLVTHRLPLEEAAVGYDLFQRKHDGCIKVVLDPTIASAPTTTP